MGIDLQLVRCLILLTILDNGAIYANFGLQNLCKSKRISKWDCFADRKFSDCGFCVCHNTKKTLVHFIVLKTNTVQCVNDGFIRDAVV